MAVEIIKRFYDTKDDSFLEVNYDGREIIIGLDESTGVILDLETAKEFLSELKKSIKNAGGKNG